MKQLDSEFPPVSVPRDSPLLRWNSVRNSSTHSSSYQPIPTHNGISPLPLPLQNPAQGLPLTLLRMTLKLSDSMSVAEIVKEVPNLSLDEMKEVARALREAMEDSADLADVLAVLENPGTPIPMSEIRKKYSLC